MQRTFVVFRIIAWYNWLLTILLLTFATYTYKCLDYCLSAGVIDALAIRAKQMSNRYAKAGQIPLPKLLSEASASDLKSTGNSEELLIATAPLTIGKQKYVVKVAASEKPAKEVLHGTLVAFLSALVVGLAFATWGSIWIISRTLVPVYKIGLTAQLKKDAAVGDELDERLRDVAQSLQNLSTPSHALPGLTAAKAARICALGEKSEGAAEAKKRSFRKDCLAQW